MKSVLILVRVPNTVKVKDLRDTVAEIPKVRMQWVKLYQKKVSAGRPKKML